MHSAISVKEENGTYSNVFTSEDNLIWEDQWNEIVNSADSIEKIESLTGWGEHVAAYKIDESVYFVTDSAYIPQ